MVQKKQIKLVKEREVMLRGAIPRSSLHKAVADGVFPAPIRIGARSKRWVESELDEFFEARIEARDGAKGSK